MPRFKDLPKTHLGRTDGYLEEPLKGSLGIVGGPIQAEPAVLEKRTQVLIPAGENVFYPVAIPSEDSYAKAIEDVQAQLKDIKQDMKKLKEMVEKIDRNGLKMRSAW